MFSDSLTKTIQNEYIRVVKETIRKIDVKLSDPEKYGLLKPFHEALLSSEIRKYSAFERSFSTSLGQRVHEKVAFLIAKEKGFKVERNHKENGFVSKDQLSAINQIITDLRENKIKPNWNHELTIISSFHNEKNVPITIISDLWIEKENGDQFFYSMKSPKPNIDQTEKAKRDMLTLKAMDPNYNVYFALVYNPYGTKEKYNHRQPFTIFDMINDECVLIGKEFWNHLGGNGTYDTLLNILKSIKPTVKQIIEEWVH